MFRQVGIVVRADVSKSRGTGTVVFETPELVKEAIDSFNQFEWHGSKIIVSSEKEPVSTNRLIAF